MLSYVLRRLMLMVPTLLGIMVINFVVIQAAPGGPVEQMLSQIQGTAGSATDRVSGNVSDTSSRTQADTSGAGTGTYRGARGLPKELIERTCLVGTPQQLADTVRGLEAAGLTQIMLLPPLEAKARVLRSVAEQVFPLL